MDSLSFFIGDGDYQHQRYVKELLQPLIMLYNAQMKDDTDTQHFPETADIETSSESYASRFSGATGQWMLARQEQVVRDMLGDLSKGKLLDVGGGHGQLVNPLAKDRGNITVLGSDISCSNRLTDGITSGNITFVVGNVIDMPFPDKAFDTVLCFRLLTHCERWPKLIDELCRVARKRIIIDYPTKQSLNAIAPLLFKTKKKFEGNTRTWLTFDNREMRQHFSDEGFKLEQHVGQYFWPMVLHRMLKKPDISSCLEKPAEWLGLHRLLGSPVIASFTRNN